MNEIEKAIQEFEDNAYHNNLRPAISDKARAVALKALQEKAERDKMRCGNCKLRGTTDCPMTVQENGYSLCSDDDFCSLFEPKEGSDNG